MIYLCPSSSASTAAVLVFQKGGTTDNVWFYDMEADGFSLDDKRQKGDGKRWYVILSEALSLPKGEAKDLTNN